MGIVISKDPSCPKVFFRVLWEADKSWWEGMDNCEISITTAHALPVWWSEWLLIWRSVTYWHSQERSCRRDLVRWGADSPPPEGSAGKGQCVSAWLKLCCTTSSVYDLEHVILSLGALVTVFPPNKDPPASQGHWKDQRQSDIEERFVYHRPFIQQGSNLNVHHLGKDYIKS